MYTWIFKKVGWKFFAVGAATAVVGSKYVRPAMVSVVRTGLNVSDSAMSTWNQAKAETSRIVADASSLRQAASAPAANLSADLVEEIRMLRADVAAMKSELDARATT